MKDTTEYRDKLMAAMFKGEQAKDLLKRLDPKFVELRELYRSNLVHSVRSNSEEREIILQACRVSALEDLYESIYQEAVSGARAQQKATQLEESNGRSGTDADS